VNPRRALARLSAGTVAYAVRTQGEPELVAGDVCFALAQVPDEAGQLLLMWKWAGHDGCRAELERALLLRVAKRASEERWDNRGRKGLLRRMVALALDEVAGRNRCKGCGGSGKVYRGGDVLDCVHCGGEGAVALSERALACAAGVSKSAWHRHWGERQRGVVLMVERLEGVSLLALKGGLEES